jgi:hypothetical protein
MQGIFINGKRPTSKKAIREAIASGQRVRIEATSLHGDEYDGLLFDDDGPVVGTYHFVGPDPYTKRSFYGTIVVTANKVTVK